MTAAPATYVSFSGGMDSTALLYRAIRSRGPSLVQAASFDYGQRHRRELEAATGIAARLGVHHRVVDVRGLLSGSALLGESEVPEGHYAEDTMAATVVSGRNLLFASVLIALAQPGDTVMLGIHAGDHPVYADCRPEFADQLRTLASAAYGVKIETPWVNIPKDQIIVEEPDAPYESSWSCYKGERLHCGRCGTCVERAEAFHLAGVPDPTEYADPLFWREEVGV